MSRKTFSKQRKTLNERQPEECTHHWMIDLPRGPFSKGACKICDIEREFKNFVFYSSWESISDVSVLGITLDSKSDAEEEES